MEEFELEIGLLTDTDLDVENHYEDGSWVGSGCLYVHDIEIPYGYHEPEEQIESGDGIFWNIKYILDYD